MFDSTRVSLKGSTAQAAKAGASVSTGASTKRKRFAFSGRTISFSNSLKTSAKGCISPQK